MQLKPLSQRIEVSLDFQLVLLCWVNRDLPLAKVVLRNEPSLRLPMN